MYALLSEGISKDAHSDKDTLMLYSEKGFENRKMKKKISAGLIFAVILILVAVGLASYFSGFAALENTYGD